MDNLDRTLTLLHEAESTLGKLKLAQVRRGIRGLLARKFWREIDSAWSAVYFAIKFLEAVQAEPFTFDPIEDTERIDSGRGFA